MTLPEDDERIFDNFVHWLYTANIFNIVKFSQIQAVKHPNSKIRAVRLYIFADKYDVPELKSTICRRLIEQARESRDPPPSSTIIEAYKVLPPKSPMRRLLPDWLAMTLEPKTFEDLEWRKQYQSQPDIVLDLAHAFCRRAAPGKSKLGPIWGPKEDYYEKEDSESSRKMRMVLV